MDNSNKESLLADAIPNNTIRRLPRYYHYMQDLISQGDKYVTSDQVANYFGIHPTQVRKDLAITGLIGKPKVGHVLAEAVKSIRDFLGWNTKRDAFLVGAGNLGSAIIGYEGFGVTGVQITAAFDTDPDKIGKVINGVEVYPMRKFTDMALKSKTQIGVITCSPGATEAVANTMVVSGITAIWNFTSVKPYLPEGVIMEQTELFSCLSVISRRIKENEDK